MQQDASIAAAYLKNATALAGARREGIFAPAHAKRLNVISNVAGFICSIVFSIESRPKIDRRPPLSAPSPPPSKAVASPEGAAKPLAFLSVGYEEPKPPVTPPAKAPAGPPMREHWEASTKT